MAEVVGDIKIVGTVDKLCFYEMQGRYYVRMKPGPDRKQFFKEAKYAPQREASGRMILSARLSSLIYKQIPKEKKEYKVCCQLQKRAALLLKGGMGLGEVIEELGAYLIEGKYMTRAKAKDLQELVNDPALTQPQRSKWVRPDVDHFKGVHIRSKEGRWFRLYHRDELRLLEEYEDRIEEGDATWLTEFLVRRKKLATYRLRHKKRRRKKVVSEVGSVGKREVKRSIEVKGVPEVGKRYLKLSNHKKSEVRRVRKRVYANRCRVEDG